MGWIQTATLYILIIAASSPSLATSPKSAHEEAAEGLRSYCIGAVCLGMTIDDVKELGQLTFDTWALPHDEKPSCSTFALASTGMLTTSDGSKIDLGFNVVSSSGSTESRYRVTSVTRFFPGATPLQLDHLRQTLITRFGGLTKVPNAGDLWVKKTPAFSVSVLSAWLAQDQKPAKVDPTRWGPYLSVSAGVREDWLMTQPECQAGLPKI